MACQSKFQPIRMQRNSKPVLSAMLFKHAKNGVTGSLCFADNPIAIFRERGNTKHNAGLSGTQQNIRASFSKFIVKLDIWILHSNSQEIALRLAPAHA